MESNRKKEMCESLIQWFKVLQLQSPHGSAVELSDGVAMAQALNQIDPDTFTDTWLSKIKFEVGSNWRLKVSNLKKVSSSAMEYYSDSLNMAMTDFTPPDVMKIAEKHDPIELGRLLQLILGCAVNCSQKQNYITQIMCLEESLQRNIMTALQELETVWQGTTPSARTSLSITSTAASIDSKTASVNQTADERDALAQRCHEAERKVALLLDEKLSLQQEMTKIQEELDRAQLGGGAVAIGDDGISLGPAEPGSTRYTQLRRQLDALKDELLVSETQRDDFKIRASQQEKEIQLLQSKLDDLHKTTEELALLKDEVDALREAAEKLKICESQLTTYKNKLEDYNDLRRQVKVLEDRSADYLQQTVQQDEQLKKGSALKSQVELYKKEIEELHVKLDAEMMKSVKTEFELTNMGAKCKALQREKDSLLTERDALREACDELKCTQTSVGDSGKAMSQEMISPTLKERLERLELETKSSAAGSDEHKAVLSQFMDESNQRIEKLRAQLKAANQKVLFYQNEAQTAKSGHGENQSVAVSQLKQALEQNEQNASQLDEAHIQMAQHQSKISQLEAALTAREQELNAADARYRKSVEKTKEIIKSYDPKISGDHPLLDKSAFTENANEGVQTDRPPMGPVEEQLMASAFYKLSMACHRDAMESRLALLNGAGASFLNRQRQPAARKPQIGAQAFKK